MIKLEKLTEASFIDRVRKDVSDIASYNDENWREAREDRLMVVGKEHWPEELRKERELLGRPCMTVNVLPSYIETVIGDLRQSQVSVKILPYGGGATEDIANTYNGLIRQIELAGHARIARETALEDAISSGFGYYRICTDFETDEAFDQVIRTETIRDPFSVYFDYKCKDPEGRDAKKCFISFTLPREEAEEEYGVDIVSMAFTGDVEYIDDGDVRLFEVFYKMPRKKRVYQLTDGRTVDADKWDSILDELKEKESVWHLEPGQDGEPVLTEGPAPEGSGMPEEIINEVPEIRNEKTIDSHVIARYIVDGEKVLDGPKAGDWIFDFTSVAIEDKNGKMIDGIWPGKFIPIIPIWGKEFYVEGKRNLRGVIRNAKDAVRGLDFFTTASAEIVSRATKDPWIGTDKQFADHPEWDDPTRVYAKMAYNPDPAADGRPRRDSLVSTPLAEITQANVFTELIKSITGIFDASRGAQSNETSGIAIQARDNLSKITNSVYEQSRFRAVEYEAEQYVDLIAIVYDSFRQVFILNEDGSHELVTVNEVIQDEDTGKKVIINDLTAGDYRVIASTGAGTKTKRLEAAEALANLVTNVPDPTAAMALIAKVVKNMDWDGASETYEMLVRLLPKGLIEEIDETEEEQQPDPALIKTQLEIQGKELENKKKELEVQEQALEVEEKKLEIQMKGENLDKIMQAVARGSQERTLQDVQAIQGGMQ